MNKRSSVFYILILSCGLSINAAAQDPPRPVASPTPLVSSVLESALNRLGENGSTREQREKGYTKLLEGQRFLETAKRSMTKIDYDSNVRLAKQSFQSAVETDPSISEAYTAIAELSTIDEAIKIAQLALKVNHDSFAAHRMLARVYALRSKLTEISVDKSFVDKAIGEWKEVARLDPRGSESWAYLSELYERTGRTTDELDALNKWIGSVAPVSRFEYDFFRRATGGSDLSPDAAYLRLAAALLKANRGKEALDVISRKIADDPDSDEAVELLKQALDSVGKENSAQAIQALQQAVYSSPGNLSLVELLADIQMGAGQPNEAIKTLRSSIEKTGGGDDSREAKAVTAKLQNMLGDMYAELGDEKEARSSYDAALREMGIDGSTTVAEEGDRFFATQVFSSLVQLYKNNGHFEEAKAAIERSRAVLGKDDPFADLQLIKLLRDTGRKAEALKTIRALRQKSPTAEEYFYQEAYVLTDLGRVEEAVTMVKTKIVNKGKVATSAPAVARDINNYLTISALYTQAKKGPQAVDAAQTALALAQSDDIKEMILLTLATAQNTAGDYKGSEKTLRDILAKTPDNSTALNNLGYFMADRGENLDEALRMVQKAVKAQPENSSFLDSLGWVYFKMGNYEMAEKSLKDAVHREPTAPTSYDHLGDVYAKQGKPDLARVSWQKAINLSSDNLEVAKIKAKLVKKPGR
jgi:tetratricopeptide (TPR) repeat protein